ncbi:MAG: aminopeptidase P family protein [Candidatus Ozemobacteraceae bacterium]
MTGHALLFSERTYEERRQTLVETLIASKVSGLLFFPALKDAAMNYPGNPYPFHQDGVFTYYWGLNEADIAGVIDLDERREILFCDERPIDDEIWMGPLPTPRERARSVGVRETAATGDLDKTIKRALEAGRTVHFLPPYRAQTAQILERLFGIRSESWKQRASVDLIRAIVTQRSIKTPEEVGEIEKALEVSRAMYARAFERALPDRFEREVAGAMEGAVLEAGSRCSFPVICTIRGETLHNHCYANRMRAGDLLLIDSGAESPLGYASDITRTLPVSGTFTHIQRAMYEIVLEAQKTAIDLIKPGTMFRDVHLAAARAITRGLVQEGLMRGNPEEAVEAGAHALFFPHGLGHMLGIDVHDMESLGEDFVGYDAETKRSDQFGLAYLRLARRLQPGFTLTVEPGMYFIPALIDIWRKERRHNDFIDYEKVETFKGFGGIRIEDDVLVTPTGARILGTPIPKTVSEIEAALAK